MKRTDFIKEIKGLSRPELSEKVRETSEEMMKLRFRQASGQLEQHHRVRTLRRNRARMLTVIEATNSSIK